MLIVSLRVGLVGVVHMLRSVLLGVLVVRGCSVSLQTTRTLFAPNRVSLCDFQRTGSLHSVLEIDFES